MARTITVPDLDTANAAFDEYFRGFVISRQTDGAGGIVYVGTLAVEILDSEGNPYKTASVSKTLGSAAKTALRDFIKNNYLAEIKGQEGV